MTSKTHYHYPDTPPVDDFLSLIANVTKELSQAQTFLMRVQDDSMLLFNEADQYLKSTRNVVTASMSLAHVKTKTMTPHTFQVYLASLLDKGFKVWAKSQKMERSVSVLVRNPSSFPSIFAVYVDDHETVQFNIFEKWYGVREKFYTEEQLREQFEKSKENTLDCIAQTEKKKTYWVQVKEKPLTFIKKPYDIYLLLFKYQMILANVEKKISSFEHQIKDMQKSLQEQEEAIPKQVAHYKARKDIAESVTPFFVELGYSLEEERDRLY
jgi:hypothetical protein